VLSPFLRYITTRKSLIRHLQARGVQSIPWVLNDAHEFEKAFSLGVDGVMTDWPMRLTRFLQERYPQKAKALKFTKAVNEQM
jgi:glycerophosphoryl diester phosphodiesterase